MHRRQYLPHSGSKKSRATVNRENQRLKDELSAEQQIRSRFEAITRELGARDRKGWRGVINRILAFLRQPIRLRKAA